MSSVKDEAVKIFEESSLDLLKEDAAQQIFAVLESLQVSLDDDPLVFGPKRLQKKIAQCRRALTDCENIYSKVSNSLRMAKRTLLAKRSSLQLAMKYLYATEPEVRAGKNVTDREAIASMILKDEWTEVNSLEQQSEDWESLLVVVKSKRYDLKDIETRLRDQMRLCAAELQLGAKWGSQKGPEASDPMLAQGRADGKDIKKIDLFVSSFEEEMADVSPPEVILPSAPVVVPQAYSDTLSDFDKVLDSIQLEDIQLSPPATVQKAPQHIPPDMDIDSFFNL